MPVPARGKTAQLPQTRRHQARRHKVQLPHTRLSQAKPGAVKLHQDKRRPGGLRRAKLAFLVRATPPGRLERQHVARAPASPACLGARSRLLPASRSRRRPGSAARSRPRPGASTAGAEQAPTGFTARLFLLVGASSVTERRGPLGVPAGQARRGQAGLRALAPAAPVRDLLRVGRLGVRVGPAQPARGQRSVGGRPTPPTASRQLPAALTAGGLPACLPAPAQAVPAVRRAGGVVGGRALAVPVAVGRAAKNWKPKALAPTPHRTPRYPRAKSSLKGAPLPRSLAPGSTVVPPTSCAF